MFRSLLRLTSKTVTAQRRNTTAAAVTTVTPETSTAMMARPYVKKSTLVTATDVEAGSVRFAFKTENLAKLAERDLPETMNVLDIDHTKGNAAEILRLVIAQKDGIAQVAEKEKEMHHPLLVLVKTSLPKEDADMTEVVLGGALPQREGFHDASVVVLPSNLSSKVRSILREHKGRVLSTIPQAVTPDQVVKENTVDAAVIEKGKSKKETVVSKKTAQSDISKDEVNNSTAEEPEAKSGAVTANNGDMGTKPRNATEEVKTAITTKPKNATEEGKTATTAKPKNATEEVKTAITAKPKNATEEVKTAITAKPKNATEEVKTAITAKPKNATEEVKTAITAKPKNATEEVKTAITAKPKNATKEVKTAITNGNATAAEHQKEHKQELPSEAIETDKEVPSPLRHSVLNRAETREALRVMFRSSLAAPFQPQQQMEKELFSGRVDRVHLADILSLPLFGEGDVHVLYYRLTGAGALRTSLVTIAEILSDILRKQQGIEAKDSEKVVKKNKRGGAADAAAAAAAAAATNSKTPQEPVPLLLLVSAPFLVGEDARLLCREYQKALQTKFASTGNVTVVVPPNCFTEKNILFALRTSRVDNAMENDSQADTHDENWCGNGSLLKHGKGGILHHVHTASSRNTLSEEVLRNIVSGAVEEVALRHERSTDHLVSTLNKLVAYWSRERVIELMETLHGEREAMLEATKQFIDVQQELRATKETLQSLRNDVKAMGKIVESQTTKLNSKDRNGDPVVVEAIESLQTQLSDALSAMPTRKQISVDVCKEFGEVQKGFQRDFDTSLTHHLTSIQTEQREAIISEIKEIGRSSRDELQALRELPGQINAAVERTLNSFSRQTDAEASKVTSQQQELIASQLASLREEIRKTVECGQTRIQDAVKELFSANREKAAIDAGIPTPTDSSDLTNKSAIDRNGN